MPEPVAPKCGNCFFAEDSPAQLGTVLCQGAPPTPVIVGKLPEPSVILPGARSAGAAFVIEPAHPPRPVGARGCALWRCIHCFAVLERDPREHTCTELTSDAAG